MSLPKAGGAPALHLRIRSATVADIPAILALETQAAMAAHWSAEQYQAVFSGERPSRVALIVEAEGAVKGFIIGRVVDAEWEIENVAVVDSARRRGLGTMLVGEFLDRARARGAQSVFLEVRESNRAARLLYEKWPFAESGRRKRYYGEPEEDAIMYRLALG